LNFIISDLPPGEHLQSAKKAAVILTGKATGEIFSCQCSEREMSPDSPRARKFEMIEALYCAQ